MTNFDPITRGRNKVHKNKWTPVYQTGLNEESGISLEDFYFGLNMALRLKNAS